MNPPLPTRVAIATILGCIGILLLSACGFGGASRPAVTILQTEDFVIWQTDAAGGPDHLLGTGRISGFRHMVFASVILSNPACLAGSYQLENDLDPLTGRSSNFQLAALQQMTAKGSAHQTSAYNWVAEFPLFFTFSPPSCGPTPIHAEARGPADLRHTWKRNVEVAARPAVLSVTLYQTRPTATQPAFLWGALFVSEPGCNSIAFLSPIILPLANQTSYTFRMRDSSTLSVAGLPFTLDPDPPPNSTLTATFSGGPCDGQVITATP